MACCPSSLGQKPGGAKGNSITPSSANRSANIMPDLPSTILCTSSAISRGLFIDRLPIIGTVDPDSPDDTERAPRLSTKPPRADAVRNRQRVLEAAKEAFAAEGLAVPLDEIARRAGVGAGTVYRHFPTKEALFEAVILDRVRKLVDYAESLADADPD